MTDLIRTELEYAKAQLAKEDGQGTIEYLLVVGVLVVGIFGLMQWTNLGDAMNGAITSVVNLFSSNPFS